ncbi:MAG TPA: 4'-phosphopantetheinyl transferase superfamily protein [Candidatus Paceibacterota bacterium]
MNNFFYLHVGVDIEDVNRFNLDFKKNKTFLNRIFTKDELRYCFSKQNPSFHLAVRFAAKEAIVKAFYSLGKKPPALNKLNIKNNKNGVPTIDLKGFDVRISLSHCRDKAIAFALISKK